MNPSNNPDSESSNIDSASDQTPEKSITTSQPVTQESAESEPELTLTVAQPCKNPAGLYVGLSKKQRTALNVEVGGTVEITMDNQVIGLFTVGLGSKELADKPGAFTANGITTGLEVTLKKATESAETTVNLPTRHGIEKAPSDLSEPEKNEYDAKTTKRLNIIAERFPETEDKQEFITLPTAIVNKLTGEAKKVASIAMHKIRIGGQETSIIVVPGGTEFGFTKSAANKLNIPENLQTIGVRIDNDTIVIA